MFALGQTGCETTTSLPYSSSTENVINFQSELTEKNLKVGLAEFTQSETIGDLTCRMMGPIDIGQGKSEAEYIKSALQTELFLAGAYSKNSPVMINGHLESLSFSSMAPAKWEITFRVYSNRSDGFTVNTTYEFKTSYSAYKACENVAAAFPPAVQSLIADIINHPEFDSLF